MSADDSSLIEWCSSILNGWSYECEVIPTEASSTPDLFARSHSDKLLLEVKTRADDWPPRFEGHFIERTIRREEHAAIDRKFRDAVGQLRSKERALDPDHLIVWFHVDARHDELPQMEQIRSATYGITRIVDWGKSPSISRECLYFRESRFYRHREISGVLLTGSSGRLLLCTNNYSDRAEQFRQSPLYLECKRVGALFDPVLREACGELFIADCAGDRRDQTVLLAYLKAKYGLSMRTSPLTSVSWSGLTVL